MSIDPTGPLITFIAADPGVAAITTAIHGQKKQAEGPPFAIVKRTSSSRSFSGQGSNRMRVQSVRYVVLCYGQKKQSGYRDAYRLAGAIGEAIHQKGPLTFPAPGGSGHLGIYRMEEDSIGEALTDPETGEPFVPLLISVIAAATALA